MILPNPGPNPGITELQEYIADGTMYLDISNNLSQETNLSDDSADDDDDDDDNLCVICLESVKNTRKIGLPCGHTYHPYCIMKWLTLQERNKNAASCPFCKQKCDYEKLVEHIISTKLTDVENIINDLDYVTKYCTRRQLRECNIIILKRNYEKVRSILLELDHKGINDPINCQYIYISIVPLTENVLKLIADAQDREAETKAKTTVNCTAATTLYQKLVGNLKRRIKCLMGK